ncbi:hypothetical protein AMAG_16886 [Allomyces macrogynus ATCC 38327]|uniref:Glycosyltransferase family 28 N-terminal domain-containing protein n=1 Tax=Allomyces macrogynus (strain ATCC 38327) TaxID=578462 RepID=A0A0L0TC65_ALLM3|nr:hypothetical protein AMAG_16886 [Allomyces macrogynus ATCC 38327]|eukprot:KNE72403.1 hypothetical protein AMAG_16886 [Allomyces macrogynus ATCC 38327]
MMRNDRARAPRTPSTAAAATRTTARPPRPSRTLADEFAHVGATTATRGPSSSPYHVAFLALGSRGDVQPVLAAALALRDASVPGTLRISILAPPDFAPWIGQHQGIQFCSIRAPEESSTRPSTFFASALLSSSPRALLAIMRRFTPPLVEQMDEILNHTRDADLVVCGVLSNMQGALLARRVPPGRRTPPAVVSLATFPCVHPTTHFPMPLAGRPTLVFGWLHWISFLVRELLFWLFLASLIQGCCRAARVQMWPSFWAYWRDLRKMPQFFAMSPTLCRVPTDWPPHATAFQGHLTYQAPAPAARTTSAHATLSPTLAAFLRRTARDARGRRRPIIYVGFGSMPVCALPSFLPLIRGLHSALVSRSAAARSPTPRFVVYAGGIAPDTTPYGTAFARLAELAPEDLIPITAEPHAALFPLCRVIVHHGGAGTSMAALAAGVPAVITPCAVDQPFWADRVHKLGCAPKPVRYTKLTPEKLGKMVWDVHVDRVGKYHAAASAAKERIAREDGAGEVVAWLSGFVPAHVMAKEEMTNQVHSTVATATSSAASDDGIWSSDDGTGSRTPPPPYRESAADASAARGLCARPTAVDEKRTLAVLQDARDAAAQLLEERFGVVVPSL